jgi:hypothetical protein
MKVVPASGSEGSLLYFPKILFSNSLTCPHFRFSANSTVILTHLHSLAYCKPYQLYTGNEANAMRAVSRYLQGSEDRRNFSTIPAFWLRSDPFVCSRLQVQDPSYSLPLRRTEQRGSCHVGASPLSSFLQIVLAFVKTFSSHLSNAAPLPSSCESSLTSRNEANARALPRFPSTSLVNASAF